MEVRLCVHEVEQVQKADVLLVTIPCQYEGINNSVTLKSRSAFIAEAKSAISTQIYEASAVLHLMVGQL